MDIVFTAALLSIIARAIRSVAWDIGDDVVQDIMQDTCTKMWNNRDKYDSSKGTVEAWAIVIARNTARDHADLKRERNDTLDRPAYKSDDSDGPMLVDVLHGHFLDPEMACIVREEYEEARAIARDMGPAYADMFDAVCDGADDEDVAKDRQESHGAVRKRKADMRKRLRRGS